MKKMKRLATIVASFILGLPYLLMAQDGGTYIEDLNTQDSDYMNQGMPATESTSSGNTAIYIVVAVVVIAAVVFFVMKKKKK